jgi:hypothetical protein
MIAASIGNTNLFDKEVVPVLLGELFASLRAILFFFSQRRRDAKEGN